MTQQDNRFFEGQSVEAIYYTDDSYVRVGSNGVEKITIIMEHGQMAEVAWFAVWRNDRIESKHNAAHIASVDLVK